MGHICRIARDMLLYISGPVETYSHLITFQGLWIGMIIGVVMQSLVLGYITYKTDWNEQVNHNYCNLYSRNVI